MHHEETHKHMFRAIYIHGIRQGRFKIWSGRKRCSMMTFSAANRYVMRGEIIAVSYIMHHCVQNTVFSGHATNVLVSQMICPIQ